MATNNERLAQVFLWKEGSTPDLDYARQVLRAVNPDAYRAIAGGNPPLQLFSVAPPWPDEPWGRALADMRAVPNPEGAQWVDTTRYDLAGWQGTNTRTGEHVFVVTVYRRAVSPDAFQGEGVSAPTSVPTVPVPHVPYYPQFPTGPIAWPPQPHAGPYPYSGGQPGAPYPPQGYPYNPMTTNPLAAGAEATLQESYAPYYVGFGPRLTAGLMDFFFMSIFQVVVVVGVVWRSTVAQPEDFGGWLADYAVFACLSAAIFIAYHIVQWALWGQTLGKRLAGIKVVQADGSKPDFARAMLRIIGYFFSMSLAGWGFLLLALDPRRQALHDKIAETYVIPEKPKVPAPFGLPGYGKQAATTPAIPGHQPAIPTPSLTPALGMAAVGTQEAYDVVDIAPDVEEALTSSGRLGVPVPAPEGEEAKAANTTGPIGRVLDRTFDESTRPTPEQEPGGVTVPDLTVTPRAPIDAVGGEPNAGRADLASNAEKARASFKVGMAELERGVGMGVAGFKVEPNAARNAAVAFKEALDLVPNSVVYRYFYAVSLRYSEGYEVAIGEFRHVLEIDPSHYEARQQVAYGPRWHDAFAYPTWVSPAPVEVGQPLPESILSLLPQGNQAATRLVLLREGGTKCAAFLSRTPMSAWAGQPTPEMNAALHLRLSRTPQGPIIALYIVVEDNPMNPYIGETFLNPHDPDHPSDDACRLGQHMLEQLARQDRTYLIFADEDNNLILSRKLNFDSATQVSIARILYEVQSLPPQVMTADRLREAAQWHMQHFSLDQLK
jgi:uncharacterized RDD family membrane protein YckC